jgi:hypothetical protein
MEEEITGIVGLVYDGDDGYNSEGNHRGVSRVDDVNRGVPAMLEVVFG